MAGKKKRSSPPRRIRKTAKVEKEGGPREWLVPILESAYSRITPRDEAPSDRVLARAETAAAKARKSKDEPQKKPGPLRSRLQPGRGSDVLAELPRDIWVRRLKEYQARKADTRARSRTPEDAILPAPAILGQNNWVPLGPAAVAKGQANGRPTIAGRISGITFGPGGLMYAGTANGGVFRSDDGGLSWRSLMENFDVDPTSFASASLCCGAIAISPASTNRVYVGTGEGDTDALFAMRLTNALPSYRGIGPIRTDDGGLTWISEASTPSLAGFAFYQLAVDPGNADNVVGATTNGLYQRSSSATWQQRRTGAHTSVVSARVGTTTTFYAAAFGGPVYGSTNGTSWSAVGTGFPSAGVGRIALGIQSGNPNVLYAFVTNTSGGLLGVFRLDGGAGSWKTVSGVPAVLPGGQGLYDLCIAVDPNNANLIFLGGDHSGVSPYPANIRRCIVSPAGTAYSMTSVAIGGEAHADVHVLAHAPGDSNTLYTGTDGGIFVHLNATGAGTFSSRNNGLSCLCTNYLGMSPTEPSVIFTGLQDNGSARYTGEELWRGVLFGDGGYCVVHPTDPFTALAYANGTVYRTTSGGQDWANWTSVISPPWSIMAEPLINAPAGSLRVAFGAGLTVYVSNDFGITWPNVPAQRFTLPTGSGGIYSMVYASNTRMFIGTTNGRIFRADLATAWTVTRIDNAVGGALPLIGLITDIAIDWTDGALSSIYICLGGQGDARHVWRFDGTAWQSRSGTGSTGLIDVEHNAILVDPAAPANVYVGADIGVWHSTNGGSTWGLLQLGLPDAPVFDLQLHQGARLLRASLHGRGVYEYQLNPPVLGGVQLYLRDTELDTARGENTDGRNDVGKWPTAAVWHWRSPNIKIDAPTPAGYQTPTNQINFWDFHETIIDGSNGVGTIDPPLVVHNRAYVLAHNRGPFTDPAVQVMAAVTNASTVLNPLPTGYTANITAGTPLPGPDWFTLGFVTLNDLRAGFPQVAAFDLPSTILPLPASLPGQSHFCMVAFLHSAADPYTATQRFIDPLTLSEPKVAQKNLNIVQFIGTPPPPATTTGMWIRVDVPGYLFSRAGRIDLVFDARGFKGTLGIVVPEKLLPAGLVEQQRRFKNKGTGAVKKWADKHSRDAERLYYEGKYRREDFARMTEAMNLVDGRPLLEPAPAEVAVLSGLPIGPKDRHTIFVRIDPPPNAKLGDSWPFSIIQRDSATGRVHGGVDYSVRINRPFKKRRPS